MVGSGLVASLLTLPGTTASPCVILSMLSPSLSVTNIAVPPHRIIIITLYARQVSPYDQVIIPKWSPPLRTIWVTISALLQMLRQAWSYSYHTQIWRLLGIQIVVGRKIVTATIKLNTRNFNAIQGTIKHWIKKIKFAIFAYFTLEGCNFMASS